jgi:hypothetical protein
MSFTELDTTVGGATSNSYGTLEELKAYFANRSEASDFLSQSDDVLTARMIQAVLINDATLQPFGKLASNDQSLLFPRSQLKDVHGREYKDDEIPRHIKYAQFEQALYCNTNNILLPSVLTQGFSEAKLDVMSIKLDKDFVPKRLSYEAIDFLSLFGEVEHASSSTKNVRIVRY